MHLIIITPRCLGVPLKFWFLKHQRVQLEKITIPHTPSLNKNNVDRNLKYYYDFEAILVLCSQIKDYD